MCSVNISFAGLALVLQIALSSPVVLQPTVDEAIAPLNATTPPLRDPVSVLVSDDGYVTISEIGFLTDVAPNLSPEDARFLFASQMPTSADFFEVVAKVIIDAARTGA